MKRGRLLLKTGTNNAQSQSGIDNHGGAVQKPPTPASDLHHICLRGKLKQTQQTILLGFGIEAPGEGAGQVYQIDLFRVPPKLYFLEHRAI